MSSAVCATGFSRASGQMVLIEHPSTSPSPTRRGRMRNASFSSVDRRTASAARGSLRARRGSTVFHRSALTRRRRPVRRACRRCPAAGCPRRLPRCNARTSHHRRQIPRPRSCSTASAIERTNSRCSPAKENATRNFSGRGRADITGISYCPAPSQARRHEALSGGSPVFAPSRTCCPPRATQPC